VVFVKGDNQVVKEEDTVDIVVVDMVVARVGEGVIGGEVVA
jgi:hypothetical protein